MGAYYNENDPKKAAVLRELIKWGLIAHGEVDERSIEDVRPDELAGFTQCHFFAGAGIWSYALRLAGWPDDRPVWTGSCPCPSFSAAGKGEGFEDARHLWPAWYRLIRERGPATIFGEQVEAAIGFGWIDLVQTDLEAKAYAFGKIVLGACCVGAPHIRLRVYFVADSQGNRTSDDGEAREPDSKRLSATLIRANSKDTNGWRPDGASVDGRRTPEVGRSGSVISGSESLHAERRSLDEHGENGRDGQDSGWPGTHCIAGAHSEVCERSDSIGERVRAGRFRSVDEATGGMQGTDGQRERVWVNTSEHVASGNGGESECEGLEGHFGDVRDWRGPGWLDPVAARSVAAAGATRGFWSDCDWWYGRDGKYRPIGPGLFPLAHGAPARVVRLRCYGDGIVPQVAAEFIKAYLEID